MPWAQLSPSHPSLSTASRSSLPLSSSVPETWPLVRQGRARVTQGSESGGWAGGEGGRLTGPSLPLLNSVHLMLPVRLPPGPPAPGQHLPHVPPGADRHARLWRHRYCAHRWLRGQGGPPTDWGYSWSSSRAFPASISWLQGPCASFSLVLPLLLLRLPSPGKWVQPRTLETQRASWRRVVSWEVLWELRSSGTG